MRSNKYRKASFEFYLGVFLVFVFCPLLLPGDLLFTAPAAAFIILIIFDKKGIKELGSFKFWLLILILFFVMTFLLNPRDGIFLSIPYSVSNLKLAGQMFFRALSIYIGIILFTRNVSIEELVQLMRKMRLKEFSTSLPIAMNIVPLIRKNILQIITAFRIRGGFRRYRIKNFFMLLMTIFINTIHTAEELSQIMTLKGAKKVPEK
ncbi:energy-coupling factor transporter transmembrane component T [candidate division KSB1 bacterium]